MKQLNRIVAVLVLAAISRSTFAAEASLGKPDIDRAVAAIADYDLGKPPGPLTEIERIIRLTHDQADLRHHLEEQLIRMLESTQSLDSKQFICEQLWVIGTERSIPTLQRLLQDEKTSHMACIALRTNPSPLASKALRDAAAAAQGQALLGILGILGDRRDLDSVPMLSRLLSDKAPNVALAAASALGRIGGIEAAAALRQARATARENLRNPFNDAYLQCAARLAEQGHAPHAQAIYQELAAKDESMLYRRAALIGLIGLGGPEALNLALATLHDGERMLQATAIAQVPALKETDVTERFARELPNLSASLQVALIGALTERADVAARPAIIAALANDDADVRTAALKALGTLGDASSVPLLARMLNEGKSASEQRMAVVSLRQLAGEPVNAAIIQSMQSAHGDARIQLIQVLSDRGATAAVPALLQEANSKDPTTRSTALKALALLAEPNHLPPLIHLLTSLPDDSGRMDAERAVASLARKINDESQRSAPILQALQTPQPIPARLSLLRVLGTLADAQAFAAVRSALNDANSQIREESVRILAAWPDSSAIPVLLPIATSAREDNQRLLALRGYIRLIGQATDRSSSDKLTMFGQALKLAQRPEEKKLVLAGLADLKDTAALKLLWVHMDDPTIQEEATVAAVAIASNGVTARPSVTKDILRKALPLTKNAALRTQIEQIIRQAETLDSSLRGGEFEAIEATSLFDGQTLQAWEGPPNVFRVDNGAILGGSLTSGVPRNEFLTTQREYRDFELRLQFKLRGKAANAGIQIRSRRIPNNNEMIGYQADLGDGYWGCLYDESRRNRVLAKANDAALKTLRPDDWNDYVIRCVGKRIQLWINGHQTVDYTEPDPSIEQTGLIGLQIHGGPPSEVRYREITIKELPRR